jgi:hypothetical protein
VSFIIHKFNIPSPLSDVEARTILSPLVAGVASSGKGQVFATIRVDDPAKQDGPVKEAFQKLLDAAGEVKRSMLSENAFSKGE